MVCKRFGNEILALENKNDKLFMTYYDLEGNYLRSRKFVILNSSIKKTEHLSEELSYIDRVFYEKVKYENYVKVKNIEEYIKTMEGTL